VGNYTYPIFAQYLSVATHNHIFLVHNYIGKEKLPDGGKLYREKLHVQKEKNYTSSGSKEQKGVWLLPSSSKPTPLKFVGKLYCSWRSVKLLHIYSYIQFPPQTTTNDPEPLKGARSKETFCNSPRLIKRIIMSSYASSSINHD
jgi:hypothetical protein